MQVARELNTRTSNRYRLEQAILKARCSPSSTTGQGARLTALAFPIRAHYREYEFSAEAVRSKHMGTPILTLQRGGVSDTGKEHTRQVSARH